MNIHSTEIERAPTRDEAERALRLLRNWAGGASRDEIQTLDPAVARLVPGREVADCRAAFMPPADALGQQDR